MKLKLIFCRQDRLKLGSGNLFLYIGYPNQRKADDISDTRYDFDFFMTELAEHEGMSVDIATPREHEQAHDMANRILFQEYVDILPKVAEANSISEELKKVFNLISVFFVVVFF